jgi:hypothetical protein
MSKKFLNNAQLVLKDSNSVSTDEANNFPRQSSQGKLGKSVNFQLKNPPSSSALVRSNTARSQQSEFYPETDQSQIYGYSSSDTHDSYAPASQDLLPYSNQVIDEQGRLLRDLTNYIDPNYEPEDVNTFVRLWQKPQLSMKSDWTWSSAFVFPDIPQVVILTRMDVFEKEIPKLQIGTIDRKDSIEVRNSPEWFPVRSIFFVSVPTPYTTELLLESVGPPRRSKYRPHNKQNARDMTKWNFVTKVLSYGSPMGIPGASTFFIDYTDFPDRYFITNSGTPSLGNRRLYQFAAYSATQYYILEKNISHETLDAEGGSGFTYYIEAGPIVYAKKGWRIIGSFYGFDHQMTSSSQYTIYRRTDPFPRVVIALQKIERSEEWNQDLKFYAFDIPFPGTAKYSVQHCLRSIYSNSASVSRHRLTTEDPRLPWEFRMNLYLFPAELSDCSVLPYDITKDAAMNFGVTS